MTRRPKIAHYYGRLKVAPDAPPEVIRAAYKVLVQKYHPDRNQGSFRHEVVLAALNKAQDVLLDPERRAAHDQWIRQEEIRLGLREPTEESEAGLGLRLRLLKASIIEDGLPFGEAWRMHLSFPQRAGLTLAGCLCVFSLLGGALSLLTLSQADDGLSHLIPAVMSSAPAASAPPTLSR